LAAAAHLLKGGLALGRPFEMALCVVALAGPSLGQSSEQFRKFDEKARTQTELHVCASEEAARVDAALHDTYGTLLKRAAHAPGAVEKIKKAEGAWITYRDAYIDAMYPADDKQAQYGSIFPTEVNLLRAKLTQEHIDGLQALLEQYSEKLR
jgi:uncharacterized protein YecT (DUF1311 family)